MVNTIVQYRLPAYIVYLPLAGELDGEPVAESGRLARGLSFLPEDFGVEGRDLDVDVRERLSRTSAFSGSAPSTLIFVKLKIIS